MRTTVHTGGLPIVTFTFHFDQYSGPRIAQHISIGRLVVFSRRTLVPYLNMHVTIITKPLDAGIIPILRC
jgi:hypothetical protein